MDQLIKKAIGVLAESPSMSDDEKAKEQRKLFIINIMYACLTLVFNGFLFWIGIKVFRIVKWNEKMILCMVTLLNLSLLAKVFFYIFNAYFDHRQDPTADNVPTWWFTIITFLPVIFLTMAVLVNLRNWVYYFIKIGEMAFHLTY